MPIDESIYSAVIDSQKDQIYSQAQITQIEEYFVNLLGNEGYTFAEVTGILKLMRMIIQFLCFSWFSQAIEPMQERFYFQVTT